MEGSAPERIGQFLAKVHGRRIALGGNRSISPGMQKKIEGLTKRLLRAGFSIATGGAEGADHSVMRACLSRPDRLAVFLPCTIEEQYRHYRKIEGADKAKRLRDILQRINAFCPGAIKVSRRKFRNYRDAADFRNSLIVRHSDGFIIFRPAGSSGCADALKKINKSGRPRLVFE